MAQKILRELLLHFPFTSAADSGKIERYPLKAETAGLFQMKKIHIKIVSTLLFVLAISLLVFGFPLLLAGLSKGSTRAALLSLVSIVFAIVFFKFGLSLLKETKQKRP